MTACSIHAEAARVASEEVGSFDGEMHSLYRLIQGAKDVHAAGIDATGTSLQSMFGTVESAFGNVLHHLDTTSETAGKLRGEVDGSAHGAMSAVVAADSEVCAPLLRLREEITSAAWKEADEMSVGRTAERHQYASRVKTARSMTILSDDADMSSPTSKSRGTGSAQERHPLGARPGEVNSNLSGQSEPAVLVKHETTSRRSTRSSTSQAGLGKENLMLVE